MRRARIRGDRAKSRVAKPTRSGTSAVKAFSGVARSSTAPAALPTTATAIRPRNERSQRGIRSRSARPPAKFPGVRATVLEAFATMGGSPAASRAGKVISEEPPTTAGTTPPARPAPRSITAEGPSTGRALAPELRAHAPCPLAERGELVPHDPARRLPEAAVGVQPQPLGRDVGQEGADALGHVLRSLRLEGLHVDDAGAQLLVAREVLPARGILHAAVGELEHDLRAAEIVERGEDVAVVAHRAERAAVKVAEADVHGDLGVHAVYRAVHALGHLVHGAGVHAVMGLVDLDEGGAGRHQRPALRVDDGDEVGEEGLLVAVASAELERHQQRVGPRHRGLDQLVGEAAGETELLDDAEAARRD